MLSLLTVSFTVEKYTSARDFLLILVIGSYEGNVLSSILKPYTIGVGASCTIFALFGVLLVWFWLNYERFGENRKIILGFLIAIGVLSVLNVLVAQNIDAWGHLGGFITGLPLGVLLIKPSGFDDEKR